jgi:hypothetical protein
MSDLTKEQILAADDRPSEDVRVPEWGGTVTLRVMRGAERDQLEAELAKLGGSRGEIDPAKLIGFKSRLLVRCAVNGNGGPMFDLGDVESLQEKSGAVLNRLADVALRLNGLTDRSLEDMAGNSPTAAEDSGSG